MHRIASPAAPRGRAEDGDGFLVAPGIAAGLAVLALLAVLAARPGAGLSAATLPRAHEAAHRPIGELVQRGRDEGAFRTDLPTDWLVTTPLALMHACSDEVRAGRIDPAGALHILTPAIRDVLTPRRA